jgi:probable rRNA maturation factor
MTSPTLRALIKTILSALGCPDAEVTLCCVDDTAMRALNNSWRGKDKSTDVLSFSQVEGMAVPPGGPHLLGDVVISMPTAARQAVARGHTLEEEMARLLVHGILHLLGHDHVHGGWQAKKMRAEERRLLAAVGVDIAL